jgi:plastocyanin
LIIMRLRITGSLLACVAGAGVAVGALALEPAAAPAPVPAAASGHAGHGAHQGGVEGGVGQPGGYGSAPGTAGGGGGGDQAATAGGQNGASAAGATLEINGFQFSAVRVAAGATVTVVNRDSAPHTATARDGSFDTGTIAPGASASFPAPSRPGSYEIFCGIHPSMTGTLAVE